MRARMISIYEQNPSYEQIIEDFVIDWTGIGISL